MLPRFGAYRLGQLPADEIENWLNDEIAAGIAPSSAHRHYRTLRRMLQVAVQKQKILTNPCERVDPPRVPKREMTFLDWDQVIRLAAILPRRDSGWSQREPCGHHWCRCAEEMEIVNARTRNDLGGAG